MAVTQTSVKEQEAFAASLQPQIDEARRAADVIYTQLQAAIIQRDAAIEKKKLNPNSLAAQESYNIINTTVNEFEGRYQEAEERLQSLSTSQAKAINLVAQTGSPATTGYTDGGETKTVYGPGNDTAVTKNSNNTVLTSEQNGTAAEVPVIPVSEINKVRTSDPVTEKDPFANPIEVKSQKVETVDLTGGQNLATGKNLANSSGKSAYGSGAKDWRFRMSLAPSANYLYKATPAGILAPLQATDGVIFPYTPSINITYSASYNSADLTHSNYKIYNYHNSAVENVAITGDFTAQDSAEANYLLAVIHFFKSATKMFYGQDQEPARGIPPPLVYLSGFGQYQFDRHPCVITNFTYNMPVDVDYINAYPTNNSSAPGGINMQPFMPQIAKWTSPVDRLRTLFSKIQPGGNPPPPAFQKTQNINEITRVPTKMTIQLTVIPIVTRNAISNQFSLKRYATGDLMKGSTNPKAGGGIW